MENQNNINASETQININRLMQQLNNDAFEIQPHQYNNQLNQLKETIRQKYDNLNEKVLSANSVLNQVQKQIIETKNYKNSLRLMATHNQNLQNIQQDAKDFFKQLEDEKEENHKIIANKILQMKLLKLEEQETKKLIKPQEEAKQLINRLVAQMKKQLEKGANQNQIQIRNMELNTKIKSAKLSVEEDSQINKCQLKQLKNKILAVCVKVEQELSNQQKALDDSFKMHFDTLQKLVVSISDRIV